MAINKIGQFLPYEISLNHNAPPRSEPLMLFNILVRHSRKTSDDLDKSAVREKDLEERSPSRSRCKPAPNGFISQGMRWENQSRPWAGRIRNALTDSAKTP